MSSESKVGGLVAKWREAAKQADAAQGKVTKDGCAYAVVFRDCADELEAALSAHGQPEPRVSQAMLDSQLETARLLDDLEKRSEARREKYGLHGQPVVDDRMVRGWRNRFISAQTELNQRANGNDYELARAYAEATANEYEAALIAALGAAP